MYTHTLTRAHTCTLTYTHTHTHVHARTSFLGLQLCCTVLLSVPTNVHPTFYTTIITCYYTRAILSLCFQLRCVNVFVSLYRSLLYLCTLICRDSVIPMTNHVCTTSYVYCIPILHTERLFVASNYTHL